MNPQICSAKGAIMPGWMKEVADTVIFAGLTQVQKKELVVGIAVVALLGYAGWGFFTFARSDEVQAVKAEVADVRTTANDVAELARALAQENLQATTQVRIEILESTLFQRRVSQCQTNDSGLRQVYAQQVQNEVNRYHRLTGRYYPLPNCDEL